jgi:hypothetical protein
MFFKIAEFDYFEYGFQVLELKNLKSLWIFKLFSDNGIGDEGAGKLGEDVSKLLNLTALNMNFR